MADLAPKVTIPTGFEEQQRELELRQKIADALLSAGMSNTGNYRSPLQVIGQLLQGAAGQHLERKVTHDYGNLEHSITASYTGARQNLINDVNSGMSAKDLVQKYGNNPYLQEDIKPYSEALSHGLSSNENIVHTPTGYRRAGDVVNQPEFNPEAMMIPKGDGGFTINMPRIAAAQMAQGFNVPPNLHVPFDLYPPNASPDGSPSAMPAPSGSGAPSSMPGGADPRSAVTDAVMQARGLRNNNPLNLTISPFTRSQQGFTGTDSGGRYATFDSPQNGLTAAHNLLQSYAQRGYNTPASIIGRWSPSSENGAGTDNYINFVAHRLGVGPHDPIDPARYGELISAMSDFENGKQGSLTRNMLPKAPSLGLPTPGQVVNGYRYRGGDPNDQNSWEQQ